MKKILSTLIMCVLLGVGSVQAQDCSNTLPTNTSSTQSYDGKPNNLPNYGLVVQLSIEGRGRAAVGSETAYKTSWGSTTFDESKVNWVEKTSDNSSILSFYDYEAAYYTTSGGWLPPYTHTIYQYANQNFYFYAQETQPGYYFSNWEWDSSSLIDNHAKKNSDSDEGSGNNGHITQFSMIQPHSNDYYTASNYPCNIPIMKAIFKPVEISNAPAATIATTDLNGTNTVTVVFPVTHADNMNDFQTPTVSGSGFTIESCSYADNKVSVIVRFTDFNKDNVNGDPKPTFTGTVTLKSAGGENSGTATITATSDLTPVFEVTPQIYDFTPDTPLDENESKEVTIVTTPQRTTTNNATWSVSLLVDAAEKGFSLETSADNPNPKVKFTALPDMNKADLATTLTIVCTYIDDNSKSITYTQQIHLSGDAGKVITIAGNENANMTFDVDYAENGAIVTQTATFFTTLTDITQTPSNFPLGDFITYNWAGDAATEISVSVKNNLLPGQYKPTLTYTSSDVTATLSIIANIRLAKPVVTTTVGIGLGVQLAWQEVYGATSYIVKSGETVVATIEDPAITTFLVDNIGGRLLVMGTEYPFTVTAVYEPNAFGNRTSDEIRATPSLPTTVSADNISALELYTGTEKYQAGHATYSKYPYREKRRIDLSAAFKDDKAIFDQLFVFGLTTGDASGNITKADASKGSNASTPCYIFVKNGNNYTLSSTIDNVNVADRPSQFKINVSGGKSYYFTGYSPYTSCGYQWEKSSGNFVNGVFSFVGDKDVNLYFDNLQLYARPKSENGSLKVTQQTFEVNGIGDALLLARKDLDGNISFSGVNVKFYTQGSGSAFCFQPIKNGATLQPTIHLKGENILESTQGVYLIVKVHFVLDFEKEASQHSAPIQVVHNEETIGTSTNLTIDDWWGGERTNGSLNLATQDSRPAPTIDLGSDKTTLNINGGQLFLSNSFNSSTEYDVSYAISYRMKSMLDGLAVIYGLGDDQPGATVLFNDGTINCKPLLSSNFNSTQGQKLFHNPTSMKCPQKTYIRGGSFNCDVLACSTTTSKGASPKNAEGGDNLCLVTIPIETLRANNTATLKPSWKTDVVELGAKPEANIKYNDGVHTGYDYYGIDCMTPQTIKDEGGNDIQVVNLMLPSDLICFKEVLTTDWALCFPKVYVKAIEEKNLGGDIEVDYSISEDDGLTKVVKTSKFLYGELDQYMVNIVNGVTVDNEDIKYSVPNEDGDVSITVSLPENGISKSVTNTQPFAVYDKMYMLMPLVANQWEMFVPPFDVANIYVVETYPEDKLIRDFDETGDGKLTNTDGHHEIDKARYAQSDRMMDLFYQWLWSVKVLNSTADIWYKDGSLWGFMLDWLDLYKDLDSKPTSKTCLQQLYHYHPTATYPSGKYWWDANFYLYQAVGDTWDYDNGELQVNWEEVPTISQPRNTAGKHNVIMKKGQVYVMSFPSTIVNNEIYDYVNTWDYWTGKYIIIEGYPEEDIDTDGNDEPDDKAQMISGSEVDWQGNNISETILAPYTAENSASLRGNSTFAKLDVSKIENAFVLNNYLRGKNASDDTDQDFGYGLVNSEYAHNVYVNLWESGFDADYDDPIHLSPGQGFILANFTAPKGMRAKAINLQSGEIAFGNEDSSQGTTTGVPTIAGNKQMMVYNIEGGVGIVPVVEQQVSIYNAAGQLVTSQYLTDEVHISLPTGIYLIVGARDQFKVVVK